MQGQTKWMDDIWSVMWALFILVPVTLHLGKLLRYLEPTNTKSKALTFGKWPMPYKLLRISRETTYMAIVLQRIIDNLREEKEKERLNKKNKHWEVKVLEWYSGNPVKVEWWLYEPHQLSLISRLFQCQQWPSQNQVWKQKEQVHQHCLCDHTLNQTSTLVLLPTFHSNVLQPGLPHRGLDRNQCEGPRPWHHQNLGGPRSQ